MSETLTKGQFAELAGVSPGRVSQWISEGKISGAALIGEGRFARIDVALASQQLDLKLDPNQRFGRNGLATALPSSPQSPVNLPSASSSTEDRASTGATTAPQDPVSTLIMAEKLRQSQLVTARLEREDREARGIYMRTEAARAEMSRVAGTLFAIFEGALTNFANALAGKFELPVRDVQYALQQEFRQVRARSAEKLREEQSAEPETVLDPGEAEANEPDPG